MNNPYETDSILNEYLLMHYGSKTLQMPWSFGPVPKKHFPVRTAQYFPKKQVDRALDLGCAVGRSSFEMSKWSKEVLGIDYSQKFIETAKKLGKHHTCDYNVKITGRTEIKAKARLPRGCFSERCNFVQGDVLELPGNLGIFDRVHAANLICRLSEPEKFLLKLPDLLVSGGKLLISTPCTWLEEFTPEKHQPHLDTIDWLKLKLSSEFKLIKKADEPFLIRETARKFQWGVSLVTFWQKL